LALPMLGGAESAHAWDEVTDVVVVGSGAAGCAAAATALAAGAQVTVCEKAGFLGGTSAKSGGAYWIPNNFDMQARGVSDPKADWLRYVARYSYSSLYDPTDPSLGLAQSTYRLLATYYDHANEMVLHLAALGALQSTPYATLTAAGAVYYPDYLEHVPENMAPRGRILSPQAPDGSIGMGDELMRQLTTHARRAGARVLLDTPVVDLVQRPDAAIAGVVVRTDAGVLRLRARRGVVFCSGGYAHDAGLIREYQPSPIFGTCALPTNTGDFVRLGARVGARLGNMAGAWRAQCVLEQALLYRSLPTEVWYPTGDSMFVVNKYGRRCFNEKRNYHDRTRASYQFDENRAEYPNLLTFPIYDQRSAERYAGNYPLPEHPLGEPYVIVGDTLDALATALDRRLQSLATHTGGLRLDTRFAATLKDTFARFNSLARAGHDPDFERGRYPFDAEVQAQEQVPRSETPWPENSYPNPVMHPLSETGPYFTMILAPAVIDTNGGPEIDPRGAVLDLAGRPIDGLFGAGNCIASPAANSYWGAGATLGSAMTFGYLAGRSASARPPA
jgi:succinate dehydrogenase/fumarate reductase flavoprotein subunit